MNSLYNRNMVEEAPQKKWYKYKSTNVGNNLALLIVLPYLLRVLGFDWPITIFIAVISIPILILLKKVGVKIH